MMCNSLSQREFDLAQVNGCKSTELFHLQTKKAAYKGSLLGVKSTVFE